MQDDKSFLKPCDILWHVAMTSVVQHLDSSITHTYNTHTHTQSRAL